MWSWSPFNGSMSCTKKSRRMNNESSIEATIAFIHPDMVIVFEWHMMRAGSKSSQMSRKWQIKLCIGGGGGNHWNCYMSSQSSHSKLFPCGGVVDLTYCDGFICPPWVDVVSWKQALRMQESCRDKTLIHLSLGFNLIFCSYSSFWEWFGLWSTTTTIAPSDHNQNCYIMSLTHSVSHNLFKLVLWCPSIYCQRKKPTQFSFTFFLLYFMYLSLLWSSLTAPLNEDEWRWRRTVLVRMNGTQATHSY